MSVRAWIILTLVLGVVILVGGGLALASCAAPAQRGNVTQEQDSCDDLEDLVDTEEDDCGIGSNKTKKPSATKTPGKASTTKATKPTTRVTPKRT